MAWTNVVTELLRALLCDGKCLRIVAELRINRRTTCCANLRLDRETLRSARGASRNLVRWVLGLCNFLSTLWRVVAWSNVVTELLRALLCDGECLRIVAELWINCRTACCANLSLNC
jgi:hypothetical protein